MKHLLVAISPHGFGHVAQTAPVVNALCERLPDLRLTLRTTAPLSLLESRFSHPFHLQPVADDFGMYQTSALDVDVEASAAAYRAFHSHWDEKVARVARELADVNADLILADVPYLTLEAARHAGIPAVAMSSLNWFDIYRHYCGDRPEAAAILEQMLSVYDSASVFLRTLPAMPMPDLSNRMDIGPVARVGQNRRNAIDARLGTDGQRLVLVGFGGIQTSLNPERWPETPDVHWITSGEAPAGRNDITSLASLDTSFSDVLASCDLLLTKPGYGSFTEAAAVGVPVLYIPRGDWPEERDLVAWLREHGRCEELSRHEWEQGAFSKSLHEILDTPRRSPVVMTGVQEAVDLLIPFLS